MANRPRPRTRPSTRAATVRPLTHPALLPLGTVLLAASVSSWAQSAAPAPEGQTLGTVTVREKAEEAEGKDAFQTRRTRIGKGSQDLRDIPQSVSVMTEKLTP
ncbi:MAG: hypothetical protein VW475_00020 [Curvibacter sp.]